MSRTVRAEPAMGTVITVDVRDPGIDPAAVEAAFAWFREVDDTFSTFRRDSEICRLLRGEITEPECRPEVREVLGLCAEVERRSGGAFDIHAGGRLDPSGLVKGWSVERAAAMLQVAGARNFFIGEGGDVVVRGEPAPSQRWRVGVRHPELADRVAAVLAAGDLAVATSGCYERGEQHRRSTDRPGPAGSPQRHRRRTQPHLCRRLRHRRLRHGRGWSDVGVGDRRLQRPGHH
jgi:thiamine biosynthesis lipoprotein